MTTTTTITTTPDFGAIKSRQRNTWASGDYAVIGTTLQLTGELLCEAVDICAGEQILDVAAGNGNAALAAARRGADVVASDYVATLLDRAAVRALADGVPITVQEADAEDLPFATDSFDGVLSTFGVMFTPRPDVAAAELLRVCRPGGRVGLANWTPDGFVGQMFEIVGRHVSPPAGVASPLAWGTAARLDELFGDYTSSLSIVRRAFVFRYRSTSDWLDAFRHFYGPMLKAFAALDAGGQRGLARDLLGLAERCNTATNGTLRIPSDYLEVVAVKAAAGSA
jgi:ubiquinone/menaquinone biosynthesis C-methylase UbiE